MKRLANKIPLEERFRRLGKGCPSDPDYVLCTLKTLAQIPILTYLESNDFHELMRLLGTPLEEAIAMTYRDAAVYIATLRSMPEHREACDEATILIAAPFFSSYLERRSYYPSSQENNST